MESDEQLCWIVPELDRPGGRWIISQPGEGASSVDTRQNAEIASLCGYRVELEHVYRARVKREAEEALAREWETFQRDLEENVRVYGPLMEARRAIRQAEDAADAERQTNEPLKSSRPSGSRVTRNWAEEDTEWDEALDGYGDPTEAGMHVGGYGWDDD